MKIALENGLVALKSGLASCECCGPKQMLITYNWGSAINPSPPAGYAATNIEDLDTSTKASWDISGLEEHGFDCSNLEIYMQWIGADDTSVNGDEIVSVDIDEAVDAGEVPLSTINIDLYAHWYDKLESDHIEVKVSYDGVDEYFYPLIDADQTSCSSSQIGYITFNKTNETFTITATVSTL